MSTSTQYVEPDPGVLERQHRRQRRRSGGKRISVFAAAAVALVLIVALVIIQSRDEVRRPTRHRWRPKLRRTQ